MLWFDLKIIVQHVQTESTNHFNRINWILTKYVGLGKKCNYPKNYTNGFIAFWKRAPHIYIYIYIYNFFFVERCIGVVKSRFQCIDCSGGVLQYTPEKWCKIITCAFILHNFCMMYRLPLPDVSDNHEPEGDGPVPAPCNTGIQVRHELVRRKFM